MTMLLFAWICSIALAAPDAVRSGVFPAGSEGYAVYRIPGLAVSPKGALLAYAEARKHTGSDWDQIDLVLRRSEDGGATWSPQQVLGRLATPVTQNPVTASRRPPDAARITYNNPVIISDAKKGLVHFLFCVEYMRAFYMRSTDDGRTFSPPVEITATFNQFRPEYNWKVIATGPGHGIQLKNGRLLVPVWLSNSETDPHHPNLLATIYSDDHGATWRRGAIASRTAGEVTNPNETVAVQLANGHVMLNARSTSTRHRRLILTSPDGASRWSQPRFQEELLEPICFGSIVRYGKTSRRGPNRLLFVNPDNLQRGGQPGEPGRSRDRRNLTVQLSEDDGATWTRKRVIDAGWSGYSDIAVTPDQSIFVLYERGDPTADRLRIVALTLVRFPLDWITAGAP
ncbi:MAG: exo-alpha-sialidase [Bryobacterales bacterium]|nr:exo-alpha-sialidase [Bryobacterales bacterium]